MSTGQLRACFTGLLTIPSTSLYDNAGGGGSSEPYIEGALGICCVPGASSLLPRNGTPTMSQLPNRAKSNLDRSDKAESGCSLTTTIHNVPQ